MKKLVVLAMAVAIEMSLFADTETVGSYTWTYRINDGTAEIYNDYSVAISPKPTGTLVIPSTLGGKQVTSIGGNAFSGCSGLTSVTMPDSVTSIGEGAFYGCSGLTSVMIPSGVTSIGMNVFSGCSGLTSVTIPDSVTSIRWAAFSGCSGLTNVTMSVNVTNIGNHVFYGCSELKSVTVIEKVRPKVAFRNVAAFRDSLDTNKAISDIMSSAEQPLCQEQFGVQCEIYQSTISAFDDSVMRESCRQSGVQCEIHRELVAGVAIDMSTVQVYLSWYESDEPWGYDSWKEIKTGSTKVKRAQLSACEGTSFVFRSSHPAAPDAVIAPQDCPGTVQYMLEAVYEIDGGIVTNVLEASDWTNPPWYHPVDFNSERREMGFSAYTILDTIAPGHVWINEVNILDKSDIYEESNFMNQYVEIAMPAESDIYGWNLRFITGGLGDNEPCFTNVVAVFGEDAGVSSSKSVGGSANYVFLTLCNSLSVTKAAMEAGAIDGAWSVRDDYSPDQYSYLQDCFYWLDGACWGQLSDDGRINPVFPVGMQLVRPSGIIEQTVVVAATNIFAGIPYYDEVFSATNFTKKLREIDSHWFFIGEDNGNDSHLSLSATNRFAKEGSWGHLRKTPGRMNGFDLYCNVIFDANGGVCAVDEVRVEYSSEIGLMPVPTRNRAEFLGWFTAADGGDRITDMTFVFEDMTLYAHWLTEVARPVITTDGDTVFRTESCEVSITCEMEDATIYYTDDGTTPKKSVDYLYTRPIKISDTTTFKAIAVIGSAQSEYVTVTITKKLLTLDSALVEGDGVAVMTSATMPWIPVILDGIDARSICDLFVARSGAIGDKANTWLSATVEGAGTMTFWYKVSCEHDEDNAFTWDRLMVYTNDVEIAEWRIDGETDWIKRTLAFDGGTNIVKWVYFKDRTASEGEDCAWIDGLVWTPSGVEPTDPIPEIAVDATPEAVTNAIEAAGFADAESVKMAIGGSAAEYGKFKEWAGSVKGAGSASGDVAAGEAAVVANTNAAVAFLLGAERLFENAPTIEIDDFAVVTSAPLSSGGGLGTNPAEVAVSVTVRDGEDAVQCAAEKVKDMFEATTALGDWDGGRAGTRDPTGHTLPVAVEIAEPVAGDSGETMRFNVTPGDGTSPKAFLRVRVK